MLAPICGDGIVPTRLGCVGGGGVLRIPPVRLPELFCSSLDVRLCILVEARRGRLGWNLASSNSCSLWREGLVAGDSDARCAGFFATGGGAFDLPDVPEACEVTEGRLAGGGAGTGFRELMGIAFGIACAADGPVWPVWRRGGGGGGVSSRLLFCPAGASSIKFSRPILAASNGGGNFLGVVLEADVDRSVEWLMCS